MVGVSKDSTHVTVAGGGKEAPAVVGNSLDFPKNVIPTPTAARTVYTRMKHRHLQRCWTYTRIQGMLDGNPPFNAKEMARAGLSDMCNVNWKDGDAIFKSVALAYWSLFNDVEHIIEIRLSFGDDKGKNALWGKILSEEWDRVVRSWPNFDKFMGTHQAELLKFGLNAFIWKDERDWRPSPTNIKGTLYPDQARDDIDSLTTIALEFEYDAQFLWGVFQEAVDKPGGHWNAEALGQILWETALIDDKSHFNMEGCSELQAKIRNGDLFLEDLYNDDIRLVSIFQKEYNTNKITHQTIHHRITTTEFPYMFDGQYNNFREAMMYFTLTPGNDTIHANKGLGHSILPAVESVTQLDCSVLDQARRAGSLLLKGGPTRGQDQRQVRFVHGGHFDVGEAEIIQNSMGNNIGQTVEASKYFKQKIFANNNISGLDPAFADRNIQSAREVQIQATKEAKIQKNTISHYYGQLDHLFREMTRKMLVSFSGNPGHEYVEVWKKRCIKREVPEEVFNIASSDKSPDGLPEYMEIFATRSSGSGSQIADQIETQEIMAMLPVLGERGRIAALEDRIAALRGYRSIPRYFPPEDQTRQPTGDDTQASSENNWFAEGRQVVVSPDNNHAVHVPNHIRTMRDWMEIYNQNPQAMFDDTTGVTMLQKVDEVFAVAGPHFLKHLFFLSQDPTRSAITERARAEWAVLSNFGDMIANNAKAQRDAEERRTQEQIEEQAREDEQNTPDHIKARGEVARKDKMVELDHVRNTKRDRLKFGEARVRLENDAKNQELKTVNELAIKAQKELVDEQPTE